MSLFPSLWGLLLAAIILGVQGQGTDVTLDTTGMTAETTAPIPEMTTNQPSTTTTTSSTTSRPTTTTTRTNPTTPTTELVDTSEMVNTTTERAFVRPTAPPNSTWAIIGGIAGGLAFVALALGIAGMFMCYNGSRRPLLTRHDETTTGDNIPLREVSSF